jgi:hypothetical protein
MKRLPRLLLALVAPLVFVWLPPALAANCSAGKSKFQEFCQGCHTPASRAGKSAADILNALGSQSAMAGLYPAFVTDTDVDNIAEYLFVYPAACPPPTATTADVIEYYHAGFDHYFITAIADEITKLDNGTFAGWARTGRSFKVNTSAAAGVNAVCRFFSTAFAPKSSHFYTPIATECTTVTANPDWMFEAEVFFIGVPALDGTCPANTNPVYRVYNDGQGGAPNHRYTTDLTVRNAMLMQGWIPEGYGPIGVIMCAPQ